MLPGCGFCLSPHSHVGESVAEIGGGNARVFAIVLRICNGLGLYLLFVAFVSHTGIAIGL